MKTGVPVKRCKTPGENGAVPVKKRRKVLKIQGFLIVQNPVDNVDNSLVSVGCRRLIFLHRRRIMLKIREKRET